MLRGSIKNERKRIEALLIDPSLEMRNVRLMRWDNGKGTGEESLPKYVLLDWNSVVESN